MTVTGLKLFHISENSGIKEFIPRKSKQICGYKAYVWAISESMIQNYMFPRECPRICVDSEMATPLSKWIEEKDVENIKALIFISNDWEKRLKTCALYKYEFNSENFKVIDSIAGYYVSELKEKPIKVYEIRNCLELLESMQVAVLIKQNQELRDIIKK